MSNSAKEPTKLVTAASQPIFEACERRLVLSAQLLVDMLSDPMLEMHSQFAASADHLETCSSPTLGEQPGDSVNHPSTIGWIPTEPQLREAHQATGWNDVQAEFGLTGRGQTVAVIDSGIAWDHVSLGKGYGPGYRVVGGWDFTEENDALPYDDGPLGFHGTHVSGIIGSDHPTHSGVAPEVDFVALRVFNDLGQGQLSWVEDALQWVHDNHDKLENPITTVNLSLGTTWNSDTIPSWASLEDELRALYEDGIVVTASAGNSFADYGTAGLSYPAASSYVLPVASVDDDGLLSDFSQRHSRAIAAPGGNILSTVPDHVLGANGRVDDFAAASGTSMAAPYVAGASVLVRQAMEMVGLQDINLTTINEHLRATGQSIFDAATNAYYSRLDLQNAIDALIPDDDIGSTFETGQDINPAQSIINGWVNSLGDTDTYRFTASSNGSLNLAAESDWLDSLAWTLQTSTGDILQTSDGTGASQILAGQSYEIRVGATGEIGPFSFLLNFTETPGGGTGEGPPASPGGIPATPVTDLGSIHTLSNEDATPGSYLARASQDGIFTVQWTSDQPLPSTSAQIEVSDSDGIRIVDRSWQDGLLRVDVQVQAGDELRFTVTDQHSGTLSLANALSIDGANATLTGSNDSDAMRLNLNSSIQVGIGEIDYQLTGPDAISFSTSTPITSVSIEALGGNDSIVIVGSAQADKVDLRPGITTIDSRGATLELTSVEQVDYTSGGGRDRVYLYDSDQDDTLRARPRSASLEGVGYRFDVNDVDRIFIHATGSGQDHAYLYDSTGDDRLSMRPQFTSMSGENFFNYVRGFERVYAYANEGGHDSALLYDSQGNDRFATSGQSASVTGPGFASFSRSFESVKAIAEAGGNDLATLYGTNTSVRWNQGSDFISMQDGNLAREARGFTQVETYMSGSPHSLATQQYVTTPSSVSGPSGVSDPTTVAQATASENPTESAAASPPITELYSPASAGSTTLPLLSDAVPSYRPNTIDPSDLVADHQAESELLETAQELSNWLTDELQSSQRVAERLDLPEALWDGDLTLEDQLLDEIFGQFGQQ